MSRSLSVTPHQGPPSRSRVRSIESRQLAWRGKRDDAVVSSSALASKVAHDLTQGFPASESDTHQRSCGTITSKMLALQCIDRTKDEGLFGDAKEATLLEDVADTHNTHHHTEDAVALEEARQYFTLELRRFASMVEETKRKMHVEITEFRQRLAVQEAQANRNVADMQKYVDSAFNRADGLERVIEKFEEKLKLQEKTSLDKTKAQDVLTQGVENLQAEQDGVGRSVASLQSILADVDTRIRLVEERRSRDLVMVAQDIFQVVTGSVMDATDLQTFKYLHVTPSARDSATASCSVAHVSSTGYAPDRVINIKNLQDESVASKAHRYQVKETIWDAALFLGCREVGFFANSILVFCLVACTVVQGLFCLIVWNLAITSEENFNSVHELRLWRQNVSAVERQRVCSLDNSLPNNTHQFDIVDDLSLYTEPIFGGALLWGPTLCFLVNLSWAFSIWNVARELVDCLTATVWSYSPASKEMRILAHLNNYTVEEIPRNRVIWMFFIGLLQFVISFVLLFYGSTWLVTLTDLAELLSSAVALTYILEIDELFYLVLVPRQIKALMHNLDPLPLPVASFKIEQKFCNSGVAPLVWLVMLLGFMSYIFSFELNPLIFDALDVLDAICPG